MRNARAHTHRAHTPRTHTAQSRNPLSGDAELAVRHALRSWSCQSCGFLRRHTCVGGPAAARLAAHAAALCRLDRANPRSAQCLQWVICLCVAVSQGNASSRSIRAEHTTSSANKTTINMAADTMIITNSRMHARNLRGLERSAD